MNEPSTVFSWFKVYGTPSLYIYLSVYLSLFLSLIYIYIY